MPDAIVQIDDQAARASFKEMADPGLMRKILAAAGYEARVATIEHFRAREQEPENTAGFPKYGQSFGKRGFWAGTKGNSVAEAVGPVVVVDDNTMAIPIDSPKLAHKADPNPPPIVPQGGRKFLAIPANARAAAWDAMPRDLDVSGGMTFCYSLTPEGRWAPSLAAREHHLRTVKRGQHKGATATDGKSTRGQGDVQYWLVRSVQTKHDPRAMPDAAVLTERANTRAVSVLQRYQTAS